MSDPARIMLANPGMGIFVQQVGRALFESGMLKRFLTTIVDRSDGRWWRQVMGSSWMNNMLDRRAVKEFPAALAVGYPDRELARLLVHRIDRSGVWTDRVWEWAEHGFDAWVARQSLDGSEGMYAYEHAALRTFLAAKARGLACIYDVPAPEHEFAQRVRNDEIAVHPELNSAYERHIRRQCARRTARRRAEWEAADLVITGSEFSKATYAAAGLDVAKVRVVPPGAPPVSVEAERGIGPRPDAPVRVLFVGAVAIHKGVHHLLEAWRQLHPPKGTAVLEIVGEVSLPRSVLRACPESVHFAGRLRPDQVIKHYRQADALVFPTLCDGFGMVVTEAFSQGLPVITTPCAGAAELVREGVNGFVVPTAAPDLLAHRLAWCIDHREELQAMRVGACATAAAWQWSDYRRRIVDELSACFSRNGPSKVPVIP